MKKQFVVFLMIYLGMFSAISQTWINFSSSSPSAPNVDLLKSNSQTVSFEITVHGIYSLDTVVNSTAFTRLTPPTSWLPAVW